MGCPGFASLAVGRERERREGERIARGRKEADCAINQALRLVYPIYHRGRSERERSAQVTRSQVELAELLASDRLALNSPFYVEQLQDVFLKPSNIGESSKRPKKAARNSEMTEAEKHVGQSTQLHKPVPTCLPST